MVPISRRAIASTAACSAAFLLMASAASADEETTRRQVPQLVIGIVVDQMRYDVLHRYWDDFGDDGFRRLVNAGFSFENARFDYMPTFTGPGHASIYTGTTPAPSTASWGTTGTCENSAE